jgi:hypothetical protein
MPCSAPASTSEALPARIEATVWPVLSTSSSSMLVSTGACGVSTGASLTGVTVCVAVSVAALKALVPPPAPTATLVPAVPLLWSQAR